MKANKHPYWKKAITTFLVVMAFFILSCGKKVALKEPLEKKLPAEKIHTDIFEIAEKYWHKKEYNKALAAYNRYLKKFPEGNKARDALARMAMIYYNKKQYEEALPLFLEVIDKYSLERRAEIHLLTAETYFHLKKYPESRLSALSWLELYEYYPQKEEVFFLLGQILKELNEPSRALYWWLKAFESPSIETEEKEQVKSQILDLIYQAEEHELKEMAEYAEGSNLLFPINYQLVLSYLESNKLEEARLIAKNIARLASEGEWKTKAEEILQQIDNRLKVKPNVIGCLLPLSGSFAIYGEEVLRGIELGFDIFQENNEALASIELIIRDTAGDPEIGVEIIKEFAEEQKALVTIGPLVSKVSEAAVEKAQELGMPIITLSQSEDITGRGEMVFQNCLTQEDQLRSLLNKVMSDMGLKRFAILYPDNSYGKYFMKKLSYEVENRQGIITAVELYDPNNTDFSAEIKKMVGLFHVRPKLDIEETDVLGGEEEMSEGEIKTEKEPKPIIDFDAIFIPDSYERAGVIASQLAYYDVVGVTLLGTNLWDSPKLLEIGGKYVEGAIFPSGFFPESGYAGVDDFVEQFNTHFGKDPELLAAIGYDTIRIIKEILKEKGNVIKIREDFRSSLAENRSYNSVTGPMFFDYQRRAKRDPLLLTVIGGQFFPMN